MINPDAHRETQRLYRKYIRYCTISIIMSTVAMITCIIAIVLSLWPKQVIQLINYFK